MPRFTYVNGRYVRHAHAGVHVEDRGYQFSDGVYEVVPVVQGTLIDEGPHLDRLDRSLGELAIAAPMARGPLRHVLRQVMRRNRLDDGLIYIQVTRGVAPRNHAFPDPDETQSALVVTAKAMTPFHPTTAAKGVAVITCPDQRWQRCDIKTVSLLPNCLAKQQAVEAGAFEAWMVDSDGFVTEGSASNAWIITNDGHLQTRHADRGILSGITRQAILAVAEREGLTLIEKPFSVAEAHAAREAFITSATSYVKPVTTIDESSIGNGEPGSISLKLLDYYATHMKDQGANA